MSLLMPLPTRHHLTTLAGVAAIVLACPLDAAAHTGSRPRPRAGTPPPPAAAPEVPPEVVAAAVRVVGPGYGVNRNELRPFNEEPGVALALVIKMPAGSGIVDLDEDDCQLTVFTDDAGRTCRSRPTSYRLTGTPASVTLELDLWQNLKQQKVPFKVKTGLALK